MHRPSDVCCVQHRQMPTPGDLQACPKLLYCESMAGWRGVPHPGLSNPQQAVLWHAWTRSMARSGPWRQSTTATRPHCHNDSGQTPPVNYFSRLQIIVLSVQHLFLRSAVYLQHGLKLGRSSTILPLSTLLYASWSAHRCETNAMSDNCQQWASVEHKT